MFSIYSYGADKENLFNNQELLKFVIISFIFVTLIIDSGGREKVDSSHSYRSKGQEYLTCLLTATKCRKTCTSACMPFRV